MKEPKSVSWKTPTTNMNSWCCSWRLEFPILSQSKMMLNKYSFAFRDYEWNKFEIFDMLILTKRLLLLQFVNHTTLKMLVWDPYTNK